MRTDLTRTVAMNTQPTLKHPNTTKACTHKHVYKRRGNLSSKMRKQRQFKSLNDHLNVFNFQKFFRFLEFELRQIFNCHIYPGWRWRQSHSFVRGDIMWLVHLRKTYPKASTPVRKPHTQNTLQYMTVCSRFSHLVCVHAHVNHRKASCTQRANVNRHPMHGTAKI